MKIFAIDAKTGEILLECEGEGPVVCIEKIDSVLGFLPLCVTIKEDGLKRTEKTPSVTTDKKEPVHLLAACVE
jgi:hypothetical protein